jgi:hypothetical protein
MSRALLAPKHSPRVSKLRPSEVATILILFSLSHFTTLKYFYLEYILNDQYQSYFPNALSYTQFVKLIQKSTLPLCLLFEKIKGEPTGLYFIDSTTIDVYHIKRE